MSSNIIKLILLALAANQVLASAIKGGAPVQQEEVKELAPPPEAPVKGTKALERQQQQQHYESKYEQVQQQEELRGNGKTSARKEPEKAATKEEPKQQKLITTEEQQELKQVEEQQQQPIKQQAVRYEARPQVREEQLQLTETQVKVEEPPRYEQQRSEQYEQQVEIREEQRRLEPEKLAPIPISQQQLELPEYQQQQQVIPEREAAEAEPYSFSYAVDGSSRSESGDTKGVVRGQYTLQGADGASRIVEYIADHNGFRASINTNEFGTEGRSPAGVALRSSQPSAEDITLRLEGKTREPAAVEYTTAGVKGAPPAPLATKGSAVAAIPLAFQEQQQEPVKGLKQQRLEENPLPLPLPAARKEPEQKLEESNKSAELRQAKSYDAVRQQPQYHRGGFESATAHRTYHQKVASVPAVNYVRSLPVPVPVVQPPPVVVRQPIVRSQQVVRTYPSQPAKRVYPPSPAVQAQAGYRRNNYPVVEPVREQRNPRLFYSSASGPAAPLASSEELSDFDSRSS